MPKTIKNIEELKKAGSVAFDDIVIIAGVRHTVSASYLHAEGSTANDQVFSSLKIKDPHEFCSEAYGYKTKRGIFPQCENGDFKALYRVIMALYCKQDALEATGERPVMEPVMEPIKSLANLISRGRLREKDIVVICGAEHMVRESYLANLHGNNAKILVELDISRSEIEAMYGYTLEKGTWPTYKSGDYEALYRALCYCYAKAETIEAAKKQSAEKEYSEAEMIEDARFIIAELEKKRTDLSKQYRAYNREISQLKKIISGEDK